MNNYTFVTTFSKDGFECYGREFVKTWLEHAPEKAKLLVYHESQPNVELADPRLTWRNLDHDEDRKRYIEDWGNDPDKVGTAADPNSQAVRFCHKVFAVTDAAQRVDTPWMVWCDADVTFTAPLWPWTDHICGPNHDVAYLGREDAPYTECGFVAYRVEANPVKRLLSEMRDYYVSGSIFERERRDWHDSRCFDIALANSSIPDERQLNLSRKVKGWHVWPHTVLSNFSVHMKGPRRKLGFYGNIVD